MIAVAGDKPFVVTLTAHRLVIQNDADRTSIAICGGIDQARQLAGELIAAAEGFLEAHLVEEKTPEGLMEN